MAVTNSPLVIPAAEPKPTNSFPEGDIKDAMEPLYIPPDLTWLWILLGLIAAIALAVFVWYRWFRPGRKPPPLPVGPPPYRVALNALNDVLSLIHQPEPFCTGVSDIIRTYLEEQFELRAPDRTTEEFLHELQDSDLLDDAQKASLGGFLEKCDLVKFAKYEPAETELRELHDSALKLVGDTMPMGEWWKEDEK